MRSHTLFLSLALALVPAAALADLPPPNGMAFVSYAFQVDGLAKFPDYVVVAYPWSLSNGAPTREHTLVEDGKKVSVGRRSPPPELYAVKKVAWEEFHRQHPQGPVNPGETDKAIEELLKGAVKCDAMPNVVYTLPTSDPRSEVLDKFRAEAIDDKTCHLVPAGAAGGASPESDAKGPNPAPNGDPTAAPKGGGCAGCAVGGGEAGLGMGLMAMLAGLFAARRRRA
jgi:MYXO-CTERM domain-containing protein